MAEGEAAFSSYQHVSYRIKFSKTCYRTDTCWQFISISTISSQLPCGAECGAEMSKLTDLKARNIKPGDKPISDGTVPGLRLYPSNEVGHGKWMMRYVSPTTGKRRDMGFGTYPDVTLSEAREKAAFAGAEVDEPGDAAMEAAEAELDANQVDEAPAASPLRLVVFGDSEWVRNRYLNNFYNQDLFLNAIGWLVGESFDSVDSTLLGLGRTRVLTWLRERLAVLYLGPTRTSACPLP